MSLLLYGKNLTVATGWVSWLLLQQQPRNSSDPSNRCIRRVRGEEGAEEDTVTLSRAVPWLQADGVKFLMSSSACFLQSHHHIVVREVLLLFRNVPTRWSLSEVSFWASWITYPTGLQKQIRSSWLLVASAVELQCHLLDSGKDQLLNQVVTNLWAIANVLELKKPECKIFKLRSWGSIFAWGSGKLSPHCTYHM